MKKLVDQMHYIAECNPFEMSVKLQCHKVEVIYYNKILLLTVFMAGIIEWPGLKRTTMIIEFQPPCYVQCCQPPDQAAQSHIQPGLECLQGWGIHNLLGQPVPVCHHPLSEKLPSNI